MIELDFKVFLEKTEEEDNIRETLKKLPKGHASLIKDFKFKFNKGNTLDKDNEHIGIIDPAKNSVTLAGAWNYSRSFTFLHELGHLIWAKFINSKLKKEWEQIVKETKKNIKSKDKALDQNAEELFCMNYANYYCDHPLVIYSFKEWKEFIKKYIDKVC